MDPCQYAGSLRQSRVVLRCVKKDGRCGYHKKGQVIKISDLTPGGLCPAAFYNIYYASLGILFNAEYPQYKLRIKCPGFDNFIVLTASFQRLNPAQRLLNVIKKCLYRIYPAQIHKARLAWTVNEIRGACPAGHKTGDTFPVGFGNLQITKGFILGLGEPGHACPAGFAHVFPFAGKTFAGTGTLCVKELVNEVQCPDHKANITYSMTRSG